MNELWERPLAANGAPPMFAAGGRSYVAQGEA